MNAMRLSALGLAGFLAWGAFPATLQGEKCTPRETDDARKLPEVITIVEGTVLRDADGALAPFEAGSLEAFGIEKRHIDHVEIICWKQVEAEYGLVVRSGAVWIHLVEGAPRPRRRRPA